METMKQFKYFSIMNHEKEEAYLRDMHKNGWRFVKVTGLGRYHFEKCEPADVIYRLDYNTAINDSRTEYLQIFSDCGWEYIQTYAGYSYFRKDAAETNGEESIFSDDESKTAMMGRVYKGRILPLVGILCACLLPQFIINIINKNYGIYALLGAIIGIYLGVFATCAVSYYKGKK